MSNTTMVARRVVRGAGRCDQCEVLYINGVRKHESGCPVAWRDYSVECFECGCDFVPGWKTQRICEDCAEGGC